MMLYDHYSLTDFSKQTWVGIAYQLGHDYVPIETLNILRNTSNKLDN